MKNNYVKIFWRLLAILFPQHLVKLYLRPYISLIFKLIKNKGTIQTIKILKQMRLHCTRYMCGQPLLVNSLFIGIDKDGWPKRLNFLKPLCNSSVSSNKLLLSLLTFSRAFQLSEKEWKKVKPDYNSIVDKPKGNLCIPSGVINKFVKEFNLKLPMPTFSKKDLYLSSKGGPQGKATLTALNNLMLYDNSLINDIKNITDKDGYEYLIQSIQLCIDNGIKPDLEKNSELGKISFIKDPEAKLRLVAISDYYTQIYLKKIHEGLMKLSKNLSSDRTFTQDPMNNWDSNDESFWSLDLSSATDRFPVKLQERLLTRIFDSQKLAVSWHNILSSRRFTTPEGDVLNYNTGQPMGTYSSWISFTLAHHLVVYYCAQLCGIDNFNQYIILGDDIVIKNDRIARKYIEIINGLGVSISLHKTHVSTNTYEFAKRWIQEGVEITGIPTKGILSNFDNPYIVFTILYDYFKIKNNQYYSKYSISKIVKNLYYKFQFESYIRVNKVFKKTFKTLNLSIRNYSKLQNFGLALDIQFGFATYDKLRTYFAKMVKLNYYVIPNEKVMRSEYERILAEGMATMIRRFNTSIFLTPKSVFDKFSDEEKEICENFPIFIALYNQTSNAWEESKKYKLGSSSVIDFCKNLSALNIDSIFNKDRNMIQSILNVGTVAKKGFHSLNNPWGEYYDSSIDILSMIQRNSVKAMIHWKYEKPQVIESTVQQLPQSQEFVKWEKPIDKLENLKLISYLQDELYYFDMKMGSFSRRLKSSPNKLIAELGHMFNVT
uniref:RNA dependent RNA polymerase n=1 Tax=Fusarium sambucinum mitovirus 3 TaxID=2801162 RepID=A0A810XWB7_9VIRU|nr:RNA dependent RNA polymerase [Fusarium sambucinum mitovirus 3]